MKRKIEINRPDHKVSTETTKKYEKDEDFYRRWYAKFGEPQTRTFSGDQFMKRLQEMIDFE